MNGKTHEEMTSSSIGKLLLKLSIPCVLGLLLVSATSFADAIYVSRYGGSADERTVNQGIIGAYYPIVSLVQAIGYTLGIGGGCALSRFLGQSDRKRACMVLSFSINTSVIVGAVIAILGCMFPESITRVLGVKAEWMSLAKIYARLVFLSAPFSAAVIAISSLLRAEGKTVKALVGLTLTGVMKLALTPIFLTRFDQVLNAVAVSNLISQMFGSVALFLMLHCDRLGLPWSPCLSRKEGATVLKMGVPSLFRQGTIVASTLITSRLASSLGGVYLASISVITRIMTALSSVPIGIGQGYQPIVGFNDGAGEHERIGIAFKVASIWGTVIVIPMSLLLVITSDSFLPFFFNERKMSDFSLLALRLQLGTLPLLPYTTVVSMSYQSIGKKWSALVLAALRQGVVLLPVIYCAVYFGKGTGLAMAQPIADAITFVLSVPFGVLFLRNMRQKNRKEKSAKSV